MTAPNAPRSDKRQAYMMRDFMKNEPPPFLGEPRAIEAKEWFLFIEKTLDAMDIIEDDHRVALASLRFADKAGRWWTSIKATQDVTIITWIDFSNVFYHNYFLK